MGRGEHGFSPRRRSAEHGFSFPGRSAEHGFSFCGRSAEHGFSFCGRSAENGFTLIEMLVALAVFSLAALALLRLEGVTLRTAADLDAKVAAETVARNIEVATLTDPAAPAIGRSTGVTVNAGHQLAWTRIVSGAPGGSALRIDVAVQGVSGGSPAVLTFVRGVT